jgi:hypothetical protein
MHIYVDLKPHSPNQEFTKIYYFLFRVFYLNQNIIELFGINGVVIYT